jgi:ADP-heptose:LPS heptosyltransferase
VHEPSPRILIVRLSHLGDVVHALPLLSALRAEHPDARIAWTVQPEHAELLRGRPELDSIIPFHRRGGLSAWPRLQRDLESFHATWSIDAQGNVKSAMVALASRAPRRTGLARVDWTEPFAAGTLTDEAAPAPRTGGTAHAMQRMHALIRHVAPAFDLTSPQHDWLPSVGPSAGNALLEAWLGPARGPYAILHLAHQSDVRAWRTSSFIALARNLAADHDVLVLAGPSEEAEGLEAADALLGVPRVRCIPDQCGIGALGAFLRAASEHDAVFVGCDSGPMHLAWSSGLRTLLLAGPQDERRTGPWPLASQNGSPHRAIRSATSPACAPCLARTCAHPQGPICMSRLEPATVATLVRSLPPRDH